MAKAALHRARCRPANELDVFLREPRADRQVLCGDRHVHRGDLDLPDRYPLIARYTKNVAALASATATQQHDQRTVTAVHLLRLSSAPLSTRPTHTRILLTALSRVAPERAAEQRR